MKVVSIAEMRALEAAAEALGLPGQALMEIAGRAFADALLARFGSLAGRRVVVLAGPGNNGGDGLVAARHLHDAGAAVAVLTVGRTAPRDAKLELLADRGVPIAAVADEWPTDAVGAAVAGSAVAVDALLGIGRRRPIAGAMRRVLAAAEGARVPLVALDVPSGLDADTGSADAATPRCAATFTLGAVKQGLLVGEGPRRAGRIWPVEIGLPRDLTRDLTVDFLDGRFAVDLLPPRDRLGHKGTFGRVLVVAGSAEYLGAPLLAALAATRVGAGLVTLAGPLEVALAAAIGLPEITHLRLPGVSGHLNPADLPRLAEAADRYDALVIGPGLGRHPETSAFLLAALADSRLRGGPRWVIDADALNILAEEPGWSGRLPPGAILTPHPLEMARLLGGDGKVRADRIAAARQGAADWSATLVLKGAHTVVAHADGRAAVSAWINPALATAGTGDVLAGAIAGLIAQGAESLDAAMVGVAVHGMAGDLAAETQGSGGVLASEVADLLPRAAEMLRRGDW